MAQVEFVLADNCLLLAYFRMVSLTLSQSLSLAFSAYKAGNLVESERLCKQIIAAKPDLFDALHLVALVQFLLGNREMALASYDRALAVRPDSDSAQCNRGFTLHQLERFEEALASYERSLILAPGVATTLCNYGLTLHELKRFTAALISHERALALKPDLAEALHNRGLTLHQLKRFDEALTSYDRALAVRPGYPKALSNRGITLCELSQFQKALASYDRAITLQPNFMEAHFNEAPCRLAVGDLDRGWQKYEWRWETAQTKRHFARPLWLGSQEIARKTILLYAEQGLGDTIQFCRYVPLVAERGARVILEVQPPLRGLLSTLRGVAEIVSKGEPLPDFDMHCPLLSLPLAFGTRLETVPSTTPYLSAPSKAMDEWSARLGPTARPRVGLAWSGSQAQKSDHKRSMQLTCLLSLLEANATFVSLQYDVRSEDAPTLKARKDLLDFGDELKGFYAPAALISNLDLVISVDSAMAHLAGALAKPVWVMLPFVPDWRWLLDREDSPWYPTARLFRQDESRSWDRVVARVRAALHDFVQRHA